MDPTAYYYMPHFKPGASVQWLQRYETVSHVVIRRNMLMVYLIGHESPVHPDALQLQPTAFQLTRAPDRL
ncbi:hypothetical protein D3C71_1716090 [compost metagenome]